MLERLCQAVQPAVAAPTRTEILLAQAFARFGKGRHASGLNFGDCFSYALAERLRVPLLFVGNDFSHTCVAVSVFSGRTAVPRTSKSSSTTEVSA